MALSDSLHYLTPCFSTLIAHLLQTHNYLQLQTNKQPVLPKLDSSSTPAICSTLETPDF